MYKYFKFEKNTRMLFKNMLNWSIRLCNSCDFTDFQMTT